MLKEGWVTNPLHIDHPPKPEATGGGADALTVTIDALETSIKEAQEREAALAAEVAGLKGDLKAAEELTAAETKAKDEALAQLAELKAVHATPSGIVSDAKPVLGVKSGKPA
jgi:hypothetical protein